MISAFSKTNTASITSTGFGGPAVRQPGRWRCRSSVRKGVQLACIWFPNVHLKEAVAVSLWIGDNGQVQSQLLRKRAVQALLTGGVVWRGVFCFLHPARWRLRQHDSESESGFVGPVAAAAGATAGQRAVDCGLLPEGRGVDGHVSHLEAKAAGRGGGSAVGGRVGAGATAHRSVRRGSASPRPRPARTDAGTMPRTASFLQLPMVGDAWSRVSS